MQHLSRWLGARAHRATFVNILRILKGQEQIMASLDDIKDDVTKLGALVGRLLAVIGSAPAGTFTPDQQAEIDAIDAAAKATLATDPTPPTA